MNKEEINKLKMKLQHSIYEPATPKDRAYVDGYNAAIDHLAPRIVREGFTMMHDEPSDKIIKAGWDEFNKGSIDHFRRAYKAMIAASKED